MMARVAGWVRAHGEAITLACIVGGWLLVTAGVACALSAAGEHAAAFVPAVWLVSLGALLLSLAGWAVLGAIAKGGVFPSSES